MLAYVREDELHVLSISEGQPKQLTFGAKENGMVRFISHLCNVLCFDDLPCSEKHLLLVSGTFMTKVYCFVLVAGEPLYLQTL